MNNNISLNTQAILLLTAPLIVGRSQRSEELLTATEYNRVARNIVGSRDVDEILINYTESTGRLAAKAEKTVVSGSARGIDKAAMFGTLQVGGRVLGVVADSLERLAFLLAPEKQNKLFKIPENS